MMKTPQLPTLPSTRKRVRTKDGHEKTQEGVGLRCHEQKRNRITLSRYNASYIERHIAAVHKNDDQVVCIVQADHPDGKAALKS